MYSKELKQLAEFYKDKKTTTNLTRWKKPIYYQLVEATDFLPDTSTAAQRLYHVRNDLYHIPRCKCCNDDVKWVTTYKPSQYATYCSTTCASSDNITKEKRKDTIKEKYGVEYYSQTEDFKNTRIGSTHSLEVKQKMKHINETRSLEEKSNILEKRRSTNLEKYGHTNYLASGNVRQIKKKKYGTENYVETKDFNEKRRQTMLSRYGVEYSMQSDELFDKMKNTLNERYGNSNWNQGTINLESLNNLLDVEWLKDKHTDKKIPTTEIARLLDVSTATVRSYMKNSNVNIIRHPTSYPEQQICKLLDDNNIQYITNDRKILSGKELDIYIPSHNLAIEYCGLYWHSTARSNISRNYHKLKYDLCKQQNIRLITIFEDEWIHNETLVKDKILNILGKNQTKSIFARKCIIVEVSTKMKRHFFERNHIQGDGPSSINIGLEYDGIIVAVMGFIKQKNQYYLNRYATSCKVVGGFSKLFKHFQDTFKWKKIISFADLRWSDGNLYEKTGWKLDSIIPPDYYYVDLKHQKRIHKFNFRHRNLKNILGEKYDNTKSEVENTRNNYWYRIFNCGLLKYTFSKD